MLTVAWLISAGLVGSSVAQAADQLEWAQRVGWFQLSFVRLLFWDSDWKRSTYPDVLVRGRPGRKRPSRVRHV